MRYLLLRRNPKLIDTKFVIYTDTTVAYFDIEGFENSIYAPIDHILKRNPVDIRYYTLNYFKEYYRSKSEEYRKVVDMFESSEWEDLSRKIRKI